MTVLLAQFHSYNRKWFGSKLPSDTIVKWSAVIDAAGIYDDDAGRGVILIHSALRRFEAVWKLTLLHEMAHLATAGEVAEHGPRWLKVMRSLAKRGAFNRLW